VRGLPIILAVGIAAGTLVAPAGASDATVKAAFVRGVAQIRGSPDATKLAEQLARTLVRLRADRGSTVLGLRGRGFAIQGFAWTLKGIRTQVDLVANDSGNIEAAIRHAKQADRYLDTGADYLRSAGRAFGVRVGKLNGR
jgi:hypothetical protein